MSKVYDYRTHGEPISYIKLLEVLFDLLRSTLLLKQKLSGDYEDIQFKINPYDPCLPIKMTHKLYTTVNWYVDDLKVSHEESAKATNFIMALTGIHGSSLSVSRG